MKCDAAVVHILNQGYSRDPEVMHLMRCLHFITAQFNFRVTAEHIQGTLNTAADALSRNSLHTFKVLMPHANQSSIQIRGSSNGQQAGLALHQLDSSVQTILWYLLLNAPNQQVNTVTIVFVPCIMFLLIL